ncbi:MAG: hypothetical protein IT423_23790 [Pirellulaceae bacterium]|nr:hypothetical protein [Pirellulaceae bacterium]
MSKSLDIRRQATLFFNNAPTALTHCRYQYNRIQADLIAAHVTLCREDEVVDWSAFEQRVASIGQVHLEMKFGRPVRDGNSVLLPAIEGVEAFGALRRTLLSDGTSEPRPMNAHVTIIHPRNGICTDAIFMEVSQILQPFSWTFSEIALIEQQHGGPWTTLSRYSQAKRN